MRRSLVLKITVSVKEPEYQAMTDGQLDVLVDHIKHHTMDTVHAVARQIEATYGHLGVVARAEGEL